MYNLTIVLYVGQNGDHSNKHNRIEPWIILT